MNRKLLQIVCSSLLFFISCTVTYANLGSNISKDTLRINRLNHSKKGLLNHINSSLKTVASRNSIKKTNTTLDSKFRSFPTIDDIVNKQKFNYNFENYEPEFTEEFLSENFPKSPQLDSLKNKAEKLINKVKELDKFVDVLKSKQLIELPVGLDKKDSSGNSIQIVISEAKMYPQYAELKIFAKLDIPQRGKSLFFGAEGVKFSHKGAFIGETKLVLLGDQQIPFNGDNWLLTLKGSSNLKTGEFGKSSFVIIDCKGLKEISLDANLRVSRKLLLPIDVNGNYICGNTVSENEVNESTSSVSSLNLTNNCYVGTSFNISAKGWNDLLVDISLPSFEVNGLKGWGFNIENAVLDLSDSRNSENINFPKVYDDIFAGNQEEILLWRGVYANKLQITLPKAIKNGAEKANFGANDLILDSNGVSGYFYGSNILTKEKGSAGKWPFTIDSLGIDMVINRLAGGTLSGDLQVPIMKQSLGYTGWINNKTFGLKVKTQKKINVPVFLADMELKPNSSVSVKVTEDNIYPSANLTGSLTIRANIGQESSGETQVSVSDNDLGINSKSTKKTDLTFPGIAFEELQINSEPGKPLISVEKFEYVGKNNFFNFPSSIDNLNLLTSSKNKFGLGFDISINLDKQGTIAKTHLEILSNVEEKNNIDKWKFDKFNISGVTIDVDRSGTKIKGGLEVVKDDPKYGNCFKGELTATIEKLKLTANAKAMFGKKDFSYWFVDIWTEKSNQSSKLLIKKFVGGLSYRMKKVSGNDPFTPSNSIYEPNDEYGLGLRAGVEIGTASNAFQGKAFLEMDFNARGGLNRIGFTGDGSLMISGQKGKGGGAKKVDIKALNGIESKISSFVDKNKDKIEKLMKNGNYLSVSKNALSKGEIASKGNIGVFVGIEQDFTTNTFHGEFEVYIDLKQIRGASDKANPSNTLAGRAVIHTSPSKWYLHVGTPETPISLAFSVGPETFTVNGYFMTGSVMPTQLKPHYRILQILGEENVIDNNRDTGKLTKGKGFAFGLSFEYRKSFELAIFYAFIEAGIGFDVMHRKYPGAVCAGRSGPLGNNGWYSMGQVYAYLYGEFGVRVKLFSKRRDIKILEAGVAAMLKGQFPNPTYIQGMIGAYYNVLGGLVKGRMVLKLEYGDKCDITYPGPRVVELETPVVSDINPIDKEKDVDVFTSPQITFNYPIGKTVKIETSTRTESFTLKIDELIFTSEGRAISHQKVWNDRKDILTLKLNENILPSEKDVSIMVKIKLSGVPKFEEIKTIKFKTSKAPDYIPKENILYMYPMVNQHNFYSEEFNQGYVKLKLDQEYLFLDNYKYRSQVTSSSGSIKRAELKYDSNKKMLFFDIPSKMDTNSNYKVDIMAFPMGNEIVSEENIGGGGY